MLTWRFFFTVLKYSNDLSRYKLFLWLFVLLGHLRYFGVVHLDWFFFVLPYSMFRCAVCAKLLIWSKYEKRTCNPSVEGYSRWDSKFSSMILKSSSRQIYRPSCDAKLRAKITLMSWIEWWIAIHLIQRIAKRKYDPTDFVTDKKLLANHGQDCVFPISE